MAVRAGDHVARQFVGRLDPLAESMESVADEHVGTAADPYADDAHEDADDYPDEDSDAVAIADSDSDSDAHTHGDRDSVSGRVE